MVQVGIVIELTVREGTASILVGASHPFTTKSWLVAALVAMVGARQSQAFSAQTQRAKAVLTWLLCLSILHGSHRLSRPWLMVSLAVFQQAPTRDASNSSSTQASAVHLNLQRWSDLYWNSSCITHTSDLIGFYQTHAYHILSHYQDNFSQLPLGNIINSTEAPLLALRREDFQASASLSSAGGHAQGNKNGDLSEIFRHPQMWRVLLTFSSETSILEYTLFRISPYLVLYRDIWLAPLSTTSWWLASINYDCLFLSICTMNSNGNCQPWDPCHGSRKRFPLRFVGLVPSRVGW